MSARRAPQEPSQGERSALLRKKPIAISSVDSTTEPASLTQIVPKEYVHRVLFLAFSASVGIAATAATTVFAYAVILCEEPAHCKGEEKGAYAGAVALATGIANVCGLLALGPLQHIAQLNAKHGLRFWFISRGTCGAILAIAVWLKSIHLAIFARIFEGFATDNLLQYALSVVYVSIADRPRFSRLMGYSQALFMVGMSVSPIIAGLLPNFFASFAMALFMFGVSLLYLGVLVPVVTFQRAAAQRSWSFPASSLSAADDSSGTFDVRKSFELFMKSWEEAPVAMAGVALLLFNTTQAYLFPALMVYTATKFSFTNTQNAYLVSIAATASAMYLLVVHYLRPRIHMVWRWARKKNEYPQTQARATNVGRSDADASRQVGCTHVEGDQEESLSGSGTNTAASQTDFIGAIISLSMEISVLPCVALAGEVWHVYALVSVIALGLAAPSFIKSYAVSMARDKSAAVASLAMMESIGGLLSTVILGAWQRWTGGGGTVFFVASAVVGGSLVSLIASRYIGTSPWG